MPFIRRLALRAFTVIAAVFLSLVVLNCFNTWEVAMVISLVSFSANVLSLASMVVGEVYLTIFNSPV